MMEGLIIMNNLQERLEKQPLSIFLQILFLSLQKLVVSFKFFFSFLKNIEVYNKQLYYGPMPKNE
jgi:hypothetical protein